MTSSRRDGESTADYLGRFSAELAGAALVALEREDDVNALFFAIKAAEVLSLAKALGFKPPAGKDAKDGISC